MYMHKHKHAHFVKPSSFYTHEFTQVHYKYPYKHTHKGALIATYFTQALILSHFVGTGSSLLLNCAAVDGLMLYMDTTTYFTVA